MSNFTDTPRGTYGAYPLNTFWSSRAAQDQSSSVVFTDPDALRYRAIKCLNGDTASNLCRKVLFRWFKTDLPSLVRSTYYAKTKFNLKEDSRNKTPSFSIQFPKRLIGFLIVSKNTIGPGPCLLRYTTKAKAKSFMRVCFKVYMRRIHPLLIPEIVEAARYTKNISISYWNLFFRPLSIRQKSQLNIFNKNFLEIISSKNLVQTRRFAPSTQTITSQNKGL